MADRAGRWRERCLARDGYRCQSEDHDKGCWKVGCILEVHHIVYKAHLTAKTLWIEENGISLSMLCHRRAHTTHNASLNQARCDKAVDAVNAAMPPDKPELRRPYFRPKMIA